ncbi:MAG: hypothetical protein ACC656_15290 [Candidatus Heimdallarchaeota archaeon]
MSDILIQSPYYFDAMIAKYDAEIKNAKAHLDTYLNRSVTVSEHSDLDVEIDKWLERAAAAQTKLDFLKAVASLSL